MDLLDVAGSCQFSAVHSNLGDQVGVMAHIQIMPSRVVCSLMLDSSDPSKLTENGPTALISYRAIDLIESITTNRTIMLQIESKSASLMHERGMHCDLCPSVLAIGSAPLDLGPHRDKLLYNPRVNCSAVQCSTHCT